VISKSGRPSRAWLGIFSSTVSLLIIFICLGCLQACAACDRIPAGETFWVRLLQPISSYSSKSGTLVRAILAESPECDGAPVFPAGTVIEGRIGRVRKVGMGFIHESSSVEVDFNRILPADGPPVDIDAQVIEVDNGRERVHNGVMYGIRSTDNMQDRLTTRLMHLPTWNPSTLWIVLAYRAAFPIYPEPEIYFPSGTDLRLELSSPLPLPSGLVDGLPSGLAGLALLSTNEEFEHSEWESLDQNVLALPLRTATPQGLNADVVNLVFLGSRDQVQNSFKAAGWTGSDAVSMRAGLHILGAFIALKSYAHLPISRQFLGGKPSDSMWQKSFDSFEKRDHLRIWSMPETWQGRPAWASASIRETGAVFSFRRRKVIHHTDVDLDAERAKVVRDLTLAGCVDTVHNAPRAEMPLYSLNATGDQMRTDGAVSVVQLKDCERPDFANIAASPEMPSRPRLRFTRYLRAQVLSVRNLWRANALYGAYDLTHAAIQGIRSKRSRDRTDSLARQAAGRIPEPEPVTPAPPGLALLEVR
jgi:hypothetical protein